MWVSSKISSLNTQRFFEQNQVNLSDDVKKISSGSRITTAADDTAGMHMSTRMKTLIEGNLAGNRNSHHGKSALETAEGGLGVISSILLRVRELTIRAQNDTLNQKDIDSIQTETNELLKELDHVVDTTEFNGYKWLQNNTTKLIRTGATNDDYINVDLINVDTTSLGINGLDVDNRTVALQKLDVAINKVAEHRARLGNDINTIETRMETTSAYTLSMQSAKSRVVDLDMAKKIAENSKNQIISQSSISMVSQANQNVNMLRGLLFG